MDRRDNRPRLIRTRPRAIAAVCVTVWFLLAKFWFIAKHRTQKTEWIYPLHSFLPTWLAVAGNVFTYALCAYILVDLLRRLRGAERALFTVLFAELLLGAVRPLSPPSIMNGLEMAAVFGDFVMFFAAVHLYLRLEERKRMLTLKARR